MTLDPVLQQLIASMPPRQEPPWDLPEIRRASKAMQPMIVGPKGVAEVGSVETIPIPGPTGPMDVRVYRPRGPAKTTLIYLHGGGWMIGDLGIADHVVRRLCQDVPAVVVSCTYRLAPEHPFPAAFEDTFAAARWAIANVDQLGGDPSSIVIAGDSAGGNLAAAIVLALREHASISAQADAEPPKPALTAQLLLYPVLDIRPSSWDLPSRMADADPTLRLSAAHEMVSHYLGHQDPSDWRASPAAMEDLTNLPATIMVALSVDPLHDEAIDYAVRLKKAGVVVDIIELPNLAHGFVNLIGIVPAAETAFQHIVERLKSHLA